MNKVEIERKFLVRDDWYKYFDNLKYTSIQQVYLDTERKIRIRVEDSRGYITIKEKSVLTRYEYEYEIPVEEAQHLLSLGKSSIIQKSRSCVYDNTNRNYFYIDQFFGDNEGLVIAEIELDNIDDNVKKTKWLGKEVTNDTRYYNSYLVDNPYKNWRQK